MIKIVTKNRKGTLQPVVLVGSESTRQPVRRLLIKSSCRLTAGPLRVS